LFVAITDVTANPELPKETSVYGITYWNVMSPKVAEKYLSWKAGWHANIGETSAVLAIDEKIVDMRRAPVEWPKVGEDTTTLNISASQTGGWPLVSKTGIWGDARKASRKLGEEFLQDISDGLVKTIAKYERTYGKASRKAR
jgi:creatinine amidohydrolase